MAERLEWDAKAAEHIRTGSGRYPHAMDIEPEWTQEVAGDPERVVDEPDPKSWRVNSVRIIGYSVTANAVLTVVGLRDDAGIVHGSSAWRALGADRRRYLEES